MIKHFVPVQINMNAFRKKINLGEPMIGTHICSSDPKVTELLGYIGYDYLWIDTEHSSLDKNEVENLLIAAKASGTASLVRIPWNDPVLAKPILDMGPDAIVFPYIRSVDEAKKAIASCFYPPKGIRGFGPNRVSYKPRETNYIDSYEEEIFRIVQIEHIDAVNCLEDILKIEGLDAIVIGPMDLSASVGKLAELNSPEVVKQFDRIAEIARRAKIPFGLSFDFEPVLLESWINRGLSFASLRSDLGFILNDGKLMLNQVKKMFGK